MTVQVSAEYEEFPPLVLVHKVDNRNANKCIGCKKKRTLQNDTEEKDCFIQHDGVVYAKNINQHIRSNVYMHLHDNCILVYVRTSFAWLSDKKSISSIIKENLMVSNAIYCKSSPSTKAFISRFNLQPK